MSHVPDVLTLYARGTKLLLGYGGFFSLISSLSPMEFTLWTYITGDLLDDVCLIPCVPVTLAREFDLKANSAET